MKQPAGLFRASDAGGIQWWIVFAAFPAYLSAQLMRADASWFSGYLWLMGGVNVALILILGRAIDLFERSERSKYGRNSWLRSLVVGMLVALPWLIHFVYRILQERLGWNYPGEPLELLAIASLQNATLAGAIVVRSSRSARVIIAMSFFLTLFSVIIASESRAATWVYLQAVLYALIAIWWLMGDYWERLQHRFVGQASSTRISMRTMHLVSVAAILSMLALIGIWIAPETRSLDGFLPTSGGERLSDPSARSGLGDGEMLVGAQDEAYSFGPVESNLFMEDKQPSLYDMMSELNGEVIKKKRTEAAVGIDGAVAKSNHQKLANSEGSSREFSILRHAPKKKERRISSDASQALLYYIGPSPQRLALETYECFDGWTWTHSAPGQEVSFHDFPLIHDPAGKPWVMVRKAGLRTATANTWTAAIKWIRLTSPRIPTPDQFVALHIDRVDRPEFFAWTEDEVLQMTDREQVPALTVARLTAQQRQVHHLRSQANFVREARAVASDLSVKGVATKDQFDKAYFEVPIASTLIQRTAREWTQGISTGWEQIDAIGYRLQTDFQLDDQAVVPEDAMCAVAHFLEKRRGPAYMFATTAAMLTRALGYPTRIVSGLYIDPKSYDKRSRQHIVGKEHLHWWPQVSIDGREWISFEPTPTYLAPTEKLTWKQWCEASLLNAWRWIGRNIFGLCILGGALVVGYRLRVWIIDRILTCWLTLLAIVSCEWAARWGVRLLDYRAWLAGYPRPNYRTPRQWYSHLVRSEKDEYGALDMLLRSEEQRLFSPIKRTKRRLDDRLRSHTYRLVFGRWTVGNISRSKAILDASQARSSGFHEGPFATL